MAKTNFVITAETRELERAVRRAQSVLEQMGGTAKKEGAEMDAMFKKVAASAAALFSAQQAKNFLTNVAKTRAEFEQLEVAFRTMLGSQEKSNKLMADTTEFAATTTYNLQDVANGVKQLLAYGSDASNVVEELRMLGDIAAGMSIPLNDMVYLFGTTRTQGRMYTQDLRQFMGRGIPVARELAKQFGVAEDKVGELVTQGKVGFEEVNKALKALTSDGGQFANMMDAQSKTLKGQYSNLQDAVSQMFNEIGKNNEGVMKSTIEMAKSLVDNYENIGKILKVLVVTYGAYKAAVLAVAAAHKLEVLWGTVKTFMQLTREVKNAKDAMTLLSMTMAANPWAIAAAAIAGVTTALVVFSKKSRDAQKLLQDWQEAANKYADSMSYIKGLKDEYDALMKTAEAKALNAEEQTRLNAVMQKMGQLAPEIVTEYGEGGKVLSINIKAYEDYIKKQKEARLKDMQDEKDALIKKRKLLDDDIKRREDLLAAGEITTITDNKSITGSSSSKSTRKLTDEEIETLEKALATLRKQRADLDVEMQKIMQTIDDADKAVIESGAEVNTGIAEAWEADAKEVERAMKALAKAQEDYIKQMRDSARETADVLRDAKEVELNTMEDGFDKEERLRELEHQKRLEQIERERDEYIESVIAAEKAVHEAQQDLLEATQQGYKRVAFDEGKARANVDTSAYDKATSAENTRYVREQEEALAAILDKYKDYTAQKTAIEKKFNDDIRALQKKRNDHNAVEVDAAIRQALKEKNDALFELERDTNGAYSRIFRDVKKMSREALTSAIEEAQNILNKMSGDKDASPEAMKALSDQITLMREEIDEMDFDGVEAGVMAVIRQMSRMKTLREQYNNAVKRGDKEAQKSSADEMKRLKREMQESVAVTAVQHFASGLQRAAESMKEIAKASGDVKLERTAELLESAGEMFGSVAQGAANGGAWGAVLAGVETAVNQVISAAMKYKLAVAEAMKVQREWNHEMEVMSVTLNAEDYDTLFGVNSLQKAIDAYKIAGEALKKYRAAMDKAAKTAWGEGVNMMFDNEMRQRLQTEQERMGRQGDQIRRLNAKIYDENGLLDVEAAEEFLRINTNISDELRGQIQNAIDFRKAYDDAMKAVREASESFVGSMADDMATKIFDAILSGEDAFEQLKETGVEAFKKIGQTLIKEMLISKYLKAFESEIEGLFGSNASAEDLAMGLTDVVGRMVNGLGTIYPAIEETLVALKDKMEGAGFNLDSLNERSSQEKSGITASQDSVDKTNGLLTAIQGHTYTIAQGVSELMSTEREVADGIASIARNTARIEAVEESNRQILGILQTIRDTGLKMR